MAGMVRSVKCFVALPSDGSPSLLFPGLAGATKVY
jgi:hypothetical protein